MSIMKFTYRTTELNWNSFSSRDSNILWMMNELILANLYTLNEQMEKRERLHTLYSIWFYSSIGKHFCRMIKSNLRIFLQQIEIVKIAHLKCQKIKLDPRKWFFKGKAWWQPFNRLDNIFFFFSSRSLSWTLWQMNDTFSARRKKRVWNHTTSKLIRGEWK